MSTWLLQASTLPDTIVTMPVRTWYDYTNGTLQLIVLVLAVVVLAAMAIMLITLKKAVDSAKGIVEKLYEDTKPIVAQASQVAGDAREVVSMLRADAERVNQAVGAVSAQMLDVATAMENRLDEVSAVIDVVQDELEETALTATAALRGARLGGRALAGGLGKALMGVASKSASRSPSEARDPSDDRPTARNRNRDSERDADRPRRGRSRDDARESGNVRDSKRERRYRDNA